MWLNSSCKNNNDPYAKDITNVLKNPDLYMTWGKKRKIQGGWMSHKEVDIIVWLCT